jgi:multidrug efflux system membrane fusion protein
MAARRRRGWVFALLAGVVVILIVWAMVISHQPPKTPPHSAPLVTVARVTAEDVPITVSALGAAQAWQGVVITSQVTGRLLYVAPEGTDVAAGAVLARIDPAPYRAALTQAEGALARDRAQLQVARADLVRYQTLAAQDSISRQQVETQAAVVKENEGAVEIDQGAVAAAQVNVNYCEIRSPIAGRVGVRLIDPGNVVAANSSTGIVSVNQIAPIAVTFTVPQGDFQRLSDLSGGFSRPLATQALSQETGALLGTGELTIADNHVDQFTGTVTLKARFPNQPRRLWPGQFVQVSLTLQTLTGAATIPLGAVNHGPKGDFAYVVGADSKVTVRPIAVAATQDAVAVVGSGLRVGETVVTDGQLLLKPGLQVKVDGQAPAEKPAT